MNVRFQFRLSYMDQCAMRVYGDTPVKEVEMYGAPEHTLAYFRSIWNGDAEDFRRNVLRRQGGVAITETSDRLPNYEAHWTPELYKAFVQHLKDRRVKEIADIRELWNRYECGDDEKDEMWEKAKVSKLEIPRPIYFSFTTHQYETESWYTPEMKAEVTAYFHPECRCVEGHRAI